VNVRPVSPSPFRLLLGPAFGRLPAPLRLVHGLAAPLDTIGTAEVTPAPGPLAALARRLAGLPESGRTVEVRFEPDGRSAERWSRRFDARRYASTIAADPPHLRERFGPFDVLYRLHPRADGLDWKAVAWRLGPLPLPLHPHIQAHESADGDRFRFDIEIALPLIGPVVSYRGWLLPRPRPTGRGQTNS
jgi:hypothetical protein